MARIVDSTYPIGLLNVVLNTSNTRILNSDDEEDTSSIDINIKSNVYEDEIQSHLHMNVIGVIKNEQEFMGFRVRFCMLAAFKIHENLEKETIEEFCQNYPLAVIWPYAREYVGDAVRRMGVFAPPLPMIDVQALNANLLEDGKVKVEFIDSLNLPD